MKILYIDYDDHANPYANGGQAYTTSELTKRLSKKHHITVITGNYPSAKNKNISGVKYIHLGIGSFGFSMSLLSYWLLLPIYVLAYQTKYDIVIECLTAPFTVSLVPVFAKKPLIAVVHFFDSKKLAEKYRLPFDFLQKKIIHKYSKFIVFTEELKRAVKKLNPYATVEIIPGGVQKDLIKSKIVRGDYILYLGRIDIYNKCLDLLLMAWREIDTKLIIAGNGKPSEEIKLKQIITANHLNKKISFIGRVDGKKKIDLYRKSKFVVLPSRFETFGYSALEALASGKVLVCFDIPGFRWITAKGVVKVNRITSKHLASTIIKVLDASSFRNNSEKNNRDFAKKFDWNKIANKYEQTIKNFTK